MGTVTGAPVPPRHRASPGPGRFLWGMVLCAGSCLTDMRNILNQAHDLPLDDFIARIIGRIVGLPLLVVIVVGGFRFFKRSHRISN